MSAKKDNIAIVSVGAIACAACCAGPILGFLAAIGFGTAAGFALFGTAAIVFGAVAIVLPPLGNWPNGLSTTLGTRMD